jgi:hypothetical protein
MLTMIRAEKANPRVHGETKKPKQFLITDWASQEIERVADQLGITRSEALERALRSGGMELAKNYQAKKTDEVSAS